MTTEHALELHLKKKEFLMFLWWKWSIINIFFGSVIRYGNKNSWIKEITIFSNIDTCAADRRTFTARIDNFK